MDNPTTKIRIWSEVALALQVAGLSRQAITEKLVMSVGPRITKAVLEKLP